MLENTKPYRKFLMIMSTNGKSEEKTPVKLTSILKSRLISVIIYLPNNLDEAFNNDTVQTSFLNAKTTEKFEYNNEILDFSKKIFNVFSENLFKEPILKLIKNQINYSCLKQIME